jgi:hypothetical protein
MWPSPVRTLWFPTLGIASRGAPNAAFSDDLFYYRILRVTIAPGGSVGGSVGIGGEHFDGNRTIDVELAIPPVP